MGLTVSPKNQDPLKLKLGERGSPKNTLRSPPVSEGRTLPSEGV